MAERSCRLAFFCAPGGARFSRVQVPNLSGSEKDAAEGKGDVRAYLSFSQIRKEGDSAEPDIPGKRLDKDNLDRAYKRVNTNKGALGIDGMTIEAALP